MSVRYYYRLEDDPNNDLALWSGSVTINRAVSKAQARRLVAKSLGFSTLPARTVLLSSEELESGSWDSERIRNGAPKPKKAKRASRAKTVADVPLSFDDVQAMMKKYGLA